MKICSVEGCSKPSRPRGFCDMHYQRWRKYGDPNFIKTAVRGGPLAYIYGSVMAYDGDECLPWPYAANDSGYGRVVFNGRLDYAHRVVCTVAHGPAPSPEHEARHSCGQGNMGCITKGHLSWSTHDENMKDMIMHGTACFGAKGANKAKITEDQAREIRSSDLPKATIAQRYGVDRRTVYDIQKRNSFKWLD